MKTYLDLIAKEIPKLAFPLAADKLRTSGITLLKTSYHILADLIHALNLNKGANLELVAKKTHYTDKFEFDVKARHSDNNGYLKVDKSKEHN